MRSYRKVAIGAGAIAVCLTAFSVLGCSNEAPTLPTTHVVQQGETLAVLARKYYGNTDRWVEIHAANREQLPNPSDLKIGQRLVIPALSATNATAEQQGENVRPDFHDEQSMDPNRDMPVH